MSDKNSFIVQPDDIPMELVELLESTMEIWRATNIQTRLRVVAAETLNEMLWRVGYVCHGDPDSNSAFSWGKQCSCGEQRAPVYGIRDRIEHD